MEGMEQIETNGQNEFQRSSLIGARDFSEVDWIWTTCKNRTPARAQFTSQNVRFLKKKKKKWEDKQVEDGKWRARLRQVRSLAFAK